MSKELQKNLLRLITLGVPKQLDRLGYGWNSHLHSVDVENLQQILKSSQYGIDGYDGNIISVPVDILFTRIKRDFVLGLAKLECDGFISLLGSSAFSGTSPSHMYWYLKDAAENIKNGTNFVEKYHDAKCYPFYIQRKWPFFRWKKEQMSEFTISILKNQDI